MKRKLLLINFILLAMACNNNTAQETSASVSTTAEPAKAGIDDQKTGPQGEGIVGLWKLTLEAYDDNGNKILDDDERKKGIKNRYIYRFNADGSCKIQELYKGRYEQKTENGIKMLYVYRNRIPEEEDKDPEPDIYQVISMNNTKMVLLEKIGNLVFWEFEKTG